VPPKQEITFEQACSLIEAVLGGTARQEIVDEAVTSPDMRHGLLRLRHGMRSNLWKTRTQAFTLERFVQKYDSRTRQEWFHALHDWDGKADRVNENTIPVDVLDYLIARRGAEPADRAALAILLDYYFLYLLALLALRVWDEGQADQHLDRLDRLLEHLQGPHGSGQRFADNAGTLILIATSHYELDERGFALLLTRVRTLNRAHRSDVALVHAASMGCHLRFGFEATCGRDTVALRDDNIADYPWLCFALVTVMEDYVRLRDAGIEGIERDRIVEALLNALTPDANALIGDHPPASLSSCAAERSRFRDLFLLHRQDLIAEFDRFRPTERAYSPLSLLFNFSHNVLKGMVVDALLRGEASALSLNDLLTGTSGGGAEAEAKQTVVNTLFGYAQSSPDRIRGQLTPAIIYDPSCGREAFSVTMRKIRDQGSGIRD
jgi:hypothetical protein